MYLLHNSILYFNDSDDIKEISTNEIVEYISQNILSKTLNKSRMIIFGGIGFSGYNEKFNANDGVYKNILNREQEIKETQIFERLYSTICKNLLNDHVIIFTHMPREDWNLTVNSQNKFIYVNGHNHFNRFMMMVIIEFMQIIRLDIIMRIQN